MSFVDVKRVSVSPTIPEAVGDGGSSGATLKRLSDNGVALDSLDKAGRLAERIDLQRLRLDPQVLGALQPDGGCTMPRSR